VAPQAPPSRQRREWVVNGFFLSVVDLKIPAAVKGIVVSFLVLAPNAILIGWNKPDALVPIIVMTLLLGALLGYSIERFSKKFPS